MKEKMMKLTKAQLEQLQRIAAGSQNPEIPAAGWWGSRPEKKLEELGLVVRGTYRLSLMTVYIVNLTAAGRAVLDGGSK